MFGAHPAPPFDSRPTGPAPRLQFVYLERSLPVDVHPDFRPIILPKNASVSDVGVEEMTLEFPESIYAGHHKVSTRGAHLAVHARVASCMCSPLRL